MMNTTRTPQFLNHKDEIHAWLDKVGVVNYFLEYDASGQILVSAHTGVNLSNLNLSFVPVKFKHVRGDFSCFGNLLTHLNFCPETVSNMFDCGHNVLTNLIGAPQSVRGDFICWHNQLTNLMGCPREVGRDFCCNDNLLTSLEFGPERVGSDYYCSSNKIETLQFLPKALGGTIECIENPLSLELQKEQTLSDLRLALLIEKERNEMTNSIHSSSEAKKVYKL